MEDIINGIFLLLSIILANSTSPTLGKRITNLINKNYYVRLIILYVLIFFTINFTSSDRNHIKEHIKNTSILFVIYLMVSKINIYLSILIFLLILLNYAVNSHILYLEENKKSNVEEYKKYSDYITLIIISITITGFLYKIYHKSQKLKYIFSTN